MKYQYKIIGLWGNKFENQTTFYKIDTDQFYPFNVGDEVWFPENWKEELGGGYTWEIKKIQHYLVDKFIAVYLVRKN